MDQKIQYYPDFPCRACRKDHVGRCPSHFLVLHKDLKRACEGVRNFLNVDVLMNKFETSWGKRSRTSKPPSIKQASQGNLVCAFSLPVHIGSGVNLLEVVNAGYALMGEYCKKKGIKFENRLIKASKSAASGS
ncbi:hypothetical protein BJ508DRAFT_115968 [Ascobolus immersus RN42]|uniref:Uncharacterized protein n=1 Tax=Ascobolus immersus RN42 TaxID=1160509 RepID=A0A3N4IHZ8_ASCIM|nr:hypothetical protein BJ508DRAFT_115968 [Ascobolus immersus RN42]